MARALKTRDGWRLCWTDADAKPKSMRLGRYDADQVEQIRSHVTRIVRAQCANVAIAAEQARWLGTLPDELHSRLRSVGLADERESRGTTLKQLIDRDIAASSVKKSTAVAKALATSALLEHFGADAPLRKITVEQADCWVRALADKKYAIPTVSRRTRTVKSLFARAVRWELIDRSPFAHVKCGKQTNEARKHYVAAETILKVIDAAPSHDWRCLFALARFAGLRTPSETLTVQWGHIDWARNRMRVYAVKTAAHEGGEVRDIEIHGLLRPILDEAFHAAPEGATHVVTLSRDARTNFRTHALRIIERAGVERWPKVMQNLRASRLTDLLYENRPIHEVAAEMGHSPEVALKHYAMTLGRNRSHPSQPARQPARPAPDNDGTQEPTTQAREAALVTKHAVSQAETRPHDPSDRPRRTKPRHPTSDSIDPARTRTEDQAIMSRLL